MPDNGDEQSASEVGSAFTHGEELLWAFEADGPVLSTPAVVEDTIFVGSNDEYFYAIDREKGGEIWRNKIDGNILSSPAVSDETVYFGNNAGTLYALNINNGEERWECYLGGELQQSLTMKGDVVYATSTDGRIYAISDGNRRWEYKAGKNISSPVVFDGVLYVTATNDSFFGSKQAILYAIDTDSGNKRWEIELGDASTATGPAVAEHSIYVGSDECLYAVDINNRDINWTCEIESPSTSIPTVADGTIYVGGLDGHLYAVNTDDGVEKWRFETRLPPDSPVVDEGIVYVGITGLPDGPSYIHTIDVDRGNVLWEKKINAGYISNPVSADDRVIYIGTWGGYICAFDTRGRKEPSQQEGSTQKKPTEEIKNKDSEQTTGKEIKPQVREDEIQGDIHSIHSELAKVDSLATDAEFQQARQVLDEVESRITELRQKASKEGFDTLETDIQQLEQDCDNRLSKARILSQLREMDPYKFEEMVAKIWRKQGWDAEATSGSTDRGVDVIAVTEDTFEKRRHLIQVKRHGENSTVGSEDIQRYASLYQRDEQVDNVFVVTSNEFTSEAKAVAERRDVSTVNGDELYQRLTET